MRIIKTVTEVGIKKKGVSDKTGKPWTMYNVVTDDGSIASGFQLVKVGDTVELEQDGKFLNYHPIKNIDKDWPEAKKFPQPPSQNGEDGIQATREHLMRAVNLYNLCVDATLKGIGPHLPEAGNREEQFQSTLASIWIEASSRRSTDGITWWSYIDKMPPAPIKK